eukprot:364388-Chlamydomonas_euryale.AAC.12
MGRVWKCEGGRSESMRMREWRSMARPRQKHLRAKCAGVCENTRTVAWARAGRYAFGEKICVRGKDMRSGFSRKICIWGGRYAFGGEDMSSGKDMRFGGGRYAFGGRYVCVWEEQAKGERGRAGAGLAARACTLVQGCVLGKYGKCENSVEDHQIQC